MIVRSYSMSETIAVFTVRVDPLVRHRLDLLAARHTPLCIKFGGQPLDEIEEVRLKAIRYELDILDFDSPFGQWLDARVRGVTR